MTLLRLFVARYAPCGQWRTGTLYPVPCVLYHGVVVGHGTALNDTTVLNDRVWFVFGTPSGVDTITPDLTVSCSMRACVVMEAGGGGKGARWETRGGGRGMSTWLLGQAASGCGTMRTWS